MGLDTIRRCGIVRAGIVVILAGLVGACAGQPEPAPVFQKGAADPAFVPMPTAASPAQQIVVQPGQSLGGVAHLYHVPKSAIIAANGLRPPYELRIGQRLTIPGGGNRPVQQAVRPIAAAPGVASPTPLPPPRAETLAPPHATGKAQPEIIPLDGPPPKAAAALPPPAQATLTPPRPAQPVPSPPQTSPPAVAAAPPAPQASAESGAGAGRFPWPIRGRILSTYGNAPGGGHNDGINIAAARGTPVRSIDSGTVAYAGNEVKGYGNIVLIKHANGWISAYAHLDGVNVKPGDAIAAGQVIAKVGDSGGVAEPQLHFELRRGKQPVDPKEFLAPSPSASAPASTGRAG